MRGLRGCVCAWTCLIPAFAAGQTSSESITGRLSLDAAVQLAVENNRQLQTARLQVEKAEEDLAAAKTRRLPIFETELKASS